MVILWVNIRVQLPPSWNPVFGATWLRFSSRLWFRTRARNPVGPRPGYIFSCWLVYTYKCHWPVAYLMMLSNWILSCQAWPPLARYGQWARSKHWRTAVYFLKKCLDPAAHILGVAKRIQLEFLNDIITCLHYWYKISKWYDEIMKSCSVFIESKYASLQRTNKESTNVFTSMRERHLRQYPDEWRKEY